MKQKTVSIIRSTHKLIIQHSNNNKNNNNKNKSSVLLVGVGYMDHMTPQYPIIIMSKNKNINLS